MRSSCGRSDAFSISRLEAGRWRLRRAREMLPANRECRHFQGCGEETQVPPHAWRIIKAHCPPRQQLRSSRIPLLSQGIAAVSGSRNKEAQTVTNSGIHVVLRMDINL
jgi:hypothetical protein